MKATIIVEAIFRTGFEDHLQEYLALVRQYLKRHGGQVIRRQRIKRTLYGGDKPDLLTKFSTFLPYSAMPRTRRQVRANFLTAA
jgi:hypothetical protein